MIIASCGHEISDEWFDKDKGAVTMKDYDREGNETTSYAVLCEECLKKLEDDPEFIAQGLLFDIFENILAIMKEKNITKAELAKRLGKSKSYVSRLFHGNSNLTILTLARIAKAIDVDIEPPRFLMKSKEKN